MSDETATHPNPMPAFCRLGASVAKPVAAVRNRNWIVVADSAYPAQCSEGIDTIVAEADHRVIVEKVLAAIRASGHVTAVIYTDAELMFVEEKDASGISTYRNWLRHLASDVRTLPHKKSFRNWTKEVRAFVFW